MANEAVMKRLNNMIELYESRFVSCLWNNPDFYFEVDDIFYDDFINNIWGTLFFIGYDLICNQDVKVITEQEVELYLKKHPTKSAVWNSLQRPECSAYANVMNVVKYVTADNFQHHYQQLKKYKVVKALVNENLLNLTDDNFSDIEDMTLDDLYNDYEIKMNHVFTTISSHVKPCNLYEGIEQNMVSWFEGASLGDPLMFCPGFTHQFGGIPDADVTLIGGISNAGKSSILRTSILPYYFLTDEEVEYLKYIKEHPDDTTETKKQKKIREKIESKKSVVFLNEEDISKWQREQLVWVATNKLNLKYLNKTILRNGASDNSNFEVWKNKTQILDAVDWTKEHLPDKHILFVPLPKFSTSLVIKYVKKYAAIGYKNFFIDTFKMDNTDDAKIDNNVRLQLVQNMTHLYNVAKKQGGKNVRVVCTVQLAKSQALTRYLSQESLAESKNMIDPCACGIFLRRVWEDEKAGGNNELKVYKYGTNSNPFTLSPNKNYIILFCVKTREGDVSKQCICEVDWSINYIREIGYVELQPIG